MAEINGYVPTSDHQQGLMEGMLTIVFDVHINKKYGLLKPNLPHLQVDRTAPPRVAELFRHLETELQLTNGSSNHLLLKAMCVKSSRSPHPASKLKFPGVFPLVNNHIWSEILTKYPQGELEVLVDQNTPEVRMQHTKGCMSNFLKREMKYLDVASFLPTKKLKGNHVMNLSRGIFEKGVRIKPELRKGVWMHLVGVFHPDLQSREEREQYIAKLRMVYDNLKGKLEGEDADYTERRQLVDAVYRDAIRTDPTNPFYASHRPAEASYISQHFHQSDDAEDNIQKLINIVVIYVLEHSNISYTQGMTDILSPILYVMKHEADAYICFAAMVERIQSHFKEWCTGSLLKLERLRHLCEILDPELYHYLTSRIEEDVFVLFFGMVLIECRREFSFEDSFHLLEAIWAGSVCMKGVESSPSTFSEWARYMTYQSPEVLQQVFEGTGVPYTAVPLPNTMSGSYSYQFSRNPSLLSQSPPNMPRRQSEIEPYNTIQEQPTSSSSSGPPTPRSVNQSISSLEILRYRQVVAHNIEDGILTPRQGDQSDSRLRSQSESNLHSLSSQSGIHSIRSPNHRRSASPPVPRSVGEGATAATHFAANKPGNSFSHSESELYDSFSNSKFSIRPRFAKYPTEMSDMSSISSGTASGNLISSLKSVDSRRNGMRNMTPETGSSSKSNGNPPNVPHSHQNGAPGGGKTLEVSIEFVNDDVAGGTRSSAGNSPQVVRSKPSVHPVGTSLVSGKDPPASASSKKPSQTSTAIANSVTEAASRHEKFSPPKAGAKVSVNYSEEEDPLLDLNELQEPTIVEHRGMIMNTNRRSPLLPHAHNRSSDDPSLTIRPRVKPENTYPHSDGAIAQPRKLVSTPKMIHGGKMTPTGNSSNATPVHFDETPSSHRVTPVAFFDAMEKLVESLPGRGSLFPSQFSSKRPSPKEKGSSKRNSGDEEETNIPTYRRVNRQRTDSDSDIDLAMSAIMSTEQGAPRVTRDESLLVPFSECYSLFICLSILVQNRSEIMQNGADFYHLSMILNAQAGVQDLDTTLKVAHQLYTLYRKYQEMCFGESGQCEIWLDDDRVRTGV